MILILNKLNLVDGVELFCEIGWYDKKKELETKLNAMVDNFPEDDLLAIDCSDLCDNLIANISTEEVPILLGKPTRGKVEKRQIDISGDINRHFHPGHHGPAYVDGHMIEFEIKFQGDQKWFDVQPSTYSTMNPCALITMGSIRIIYEYADDRMPSGKEIKDAVLKTKSEIEKNLERLTSDFDNFRKGIVKGLTERIKNRKEKIQEQNALLDSLPFDISE